LRKKNAVSEEVAIEMVKGAIETLNVDFAISATGFAGPGGGTKEIPIGTIWLACGNKDEIITHKLEEDEGRDVNLSVATSKAMQMIVKFIIDHEITKNS
jgi:nicotinamide-nucleotide amidase